MGRLRDYMRSWGSGSSKAGKGKPEEPRKKRFYESMMEVRFGEGAIPEGLEMSYLLPEITGEDWDGEPYMHPADAGEFAKGKTVHEMLKDGGLSHAEIHMLRDYGIAVRKAAGRLAGIMGPDAEEVAAFGNMVYTLACAKSLTRYGDPMSSSNGNTKAMMRKALEIGIVPEDLRPMLAEAIQILDNRDSQSG